MTTFYYEPSPAERAGQAARSFLRRLVICLLIGFVIFFWNYASSGRGDAPIAAGVLAGIIFGLPLGLVIWVLWGCVRLFWRN